MPAKLSRRLILPLIAGLMVLFPCSVAAAQTPKDGPNTPATMRRALEQSITLDYNGHSLDDVLEHLRQKTKLDIVVDQFVVQNMGIGNFGVVMAAPGMPGMARPAPAGNFAVKIDNGKLRIALQRFLAQHNLTYVLMSDCLLVTSEEVGQIRQLKQRVNLDIKNQPLADALQKLSDETGVNVLLDPRQAEKAKSKVSLQLDDVTVETAIRLFTELADLGAASIGNVQFVTSAMRADVLRKENAHGTGGDRSFIHSFPGGLPPIRGQGFGGGIGGFVGNAVIDPAVPPPPPPKKDGK